MADDGSKQRKREFGTTLEDARAVATVLTLQAESVLGKRTARFLGTVGAFAAAVVMLLAFLDWYIVPGTPGERKDLILTLAQILGGAALLSGLYFTWRTLQVNREGQITDRFTLAIDQLGDTSEGKPRIEIRLGGIYALERIARNSPARDHSTVMEVLTAYVRENAPWPPKNYEPSQSDLGPDSATDEATEQDGEREREEDSTPRYFPTDIQAVLNVLSRRDEERVPEQLRVPLDLQEVDLRGANLDGAHLEKVLLRGAHLEGAALLEAHMQERSSVMPTWRKRSSMEPTWRERTLSEPTWRKPTWAKPTWRGRTSIRPTYRGRISLEPTWIRHIFFRSRSYGPSGMRQQSCRSTSLIIDLLCGAGVSKSKSTSSEGDESMSRQPPSRLRSR